jgi:thymidine phosphorylase
VREHRGCLAWGGTADLSPADDMLISVERPLSIDSPGQMVASILSKKIAAGSTHLVLDIPVGPTAKVRSMPEAQRLRKLFEFVAARMGLSIDVVITDGRQPIGNGIGPVLEARDVMRCWRTTRARRNDLRQKALRLAGRMLEFDPDVRGGDGFAHRARHPRIRPRAGQDGRHHRRPGRQALRPQRPALAPLSFEVLAERDGVVTGIDNHQLARIAAPGRCAQGAGRRRGPAAQAGRRRCKGHSRCTASCRLPGRSGICPPGQRARRWLQHWQRRQPARCLWSSDGLPCCCISTDEQAPALRLAQAAVCRPRPCRAPPLPR